MLFEIKKPISYELIHFKCTKIRTSSLQMCTYKYMFTVTWQKQHHISKLEVGLIIKNYM